MKSPTWSNVEPPPGPEARWVKICLPGYPELVIQAAVTGPREMSCHATPDKIDVMWLYLANARHRIWYGPPVLDPEATTRAQQAANPDRILASVN